MAKLTVKKLESLTPADAGTRLKDDHSLYGLVKATNKGVTVMFRWRYRFGGRLRDYTCGTWPAKTLREIHIVHENARHLLAQGKDPNETKRIERVSEKAAQAEALAQAQARIDQAQALRSRITVAELFDRWAAVELVRRKDGGKEVRRMFAKDVLPSLGAFAVEDVRKGHITSVTDALLARGVTRMAKLIFSLIRQMFRYAVDRDIIDNEPTASIRKARIGGKPTERDRVLSEDEIRALHQQVPAAQLAVPTEAAVWLALATGCRIGELLRAEWNHVNLQSREWFIPGENSKNGQPHTVYLSDFALHNFITLQTINGSSRWCFPNRADSAHVCVKTVTKQLGDRQRREAAPMSRRSPHTGALVLSGGKWTPHDLRRTCATLMTKLGVLPEVAEKCINHTEENRMKRIYQRYNYDNEKREAWRLLGEHLRLLTQPDDTIIALSSRRSA